MFSRRDLLRSVPFGFGYLAMQGLLAETARAEYAPPLAPKEPHFAPKAKRVLFLCMRGAPAQVDTFDYKPIEGKQKAGSVVKFGQHGESGLWMSEFFPHLAGHADELCVINSMHTDVPNHPQSYLMMHTGDFRFARPSMGSWVLYGLGSENQNLPGFVTINPETRVGGAQNYGSAFLPPIYQGTPIGRVGEDVRRATIGNVQGDHLTEEGKRRQLDFVQQMNARRLAERQHDPALEGAIESLELAFRMQQAVPEVLDVSRESQSTLDAYAVERSGAKGRSLGDYFGLQCLMARRLLEAGVRFVEVCHSNWDQHNNHVAELGANCEAIDQPIAALLTDLKQRGMLEDTLIVWGGEFGRTPLSQGKNGSGHNSAGYTMWLAGGGVRGGLAYGKTDETGARAVENRVHVHDLHATILHLLGLDHERLTYRYSGRDFRLTDVYGSVVKDIIA